jgi:hypothetical protein
MSAHHAQLLRTLAEHTVGQLSALSASAMAHNPRKRTGQLVFWAVASRCGDDLSSAASKRGAKKKNPIAPHVEFSCSDRFSEFLRNSPIPLFNLVAPRINYLLSGYYCEFQFSQQHVNFFSWGWFSFSHPPYFSKLALGLLLRRSNKHGRGSAEQPSAKLIPTVLKKSVSVSNI